MVEERIYADWAATAPLHPAAQKVLAQSLKASMPANPSALHAYGRVAAEDLAAAREQLCVALSWDGSVCFTSGGTESDGTAVYALMQRYSGTSRRRILLSPMEHPAIREAVRSFAPRFGMTAEECAVCSDGVVDAADFCARLGDDIAFAAVLAVQNETGVIQPIDTLAEAVHSYGGAFLSDCVQAVGHIPLPTKADILTLSGHKFGGPHGTGAILYRGELAPLLVGGGQERGIRGGTENVAGVVAMAAAAMAAKEPAWMGRLRNRLEDAFLDTMGDYGYPVSIVGRGTERIGSVSCVVFGGDPRLPEGENLVLSCDMAGLAISAGSACHSGKSEPSPALLSMGYTEHEAIRQVRLSFGWATTEREMRRAFEILEDNVSRLCRVRYMKQQGWDDAAVRLWEEDE